MSINAGNKRFTDIIGHNNSELFWRLAVGGVCVCVCDCQLYGSLQSGEINLLEQHHRLHQAELV